MINMSSGVRRGLVSVAVMAALAAAYPGYDDETARSFPCPNADDILPCTCTYNSTGITIDLVCQGLTNDTQLDQIFSAVFPVRILTSLTLTDSNIATLKENVFHSVSFKNIMLFNNQLETVVAGALSSSYNTLEGFFISQMAGETLTLTMSDLHQFTNLTTFYISGPYDGVLKLQSDTLTIACLSLHELTELPNTTFDNAPALETIIMENTKLATIEADTFLSLKSLKTLTLTGAYMTTLTQSSMAFSSNLTLLDLHMNNIQTIDEEAFQGISGDVNIILKTNSLEELNEKPFSELLANITGTIDVSGNPLKCGCDLKWLINLTDENWARLVGLNQACDHEGSYDTHTLKHFLEYQCSSLV